MDDIENLILATGAAYGLEPTWIKAIITQESAWNPYAIRYESNYRYLFQPERFAKHELISLNTEICSQKISWGLGQIMGALAREQGHAGLMPELLKPEVNLKHIAIRLCYLKKISPLPDDVFAMYNGGPSAFKKSLGKYPNQEYVDSIRKHLKKLAP